MHVQFNQISKHPNYVSVLIRIRDLALKRQWQYPHFAADLFWRVASDERAFDVLHEWLTSKDDTRICAVAKLLEKAGRNFVFTNPDFVAVALHKAHEASDECYRTMRALLDSSATSGSKSGIPGEPMPRD